MGSPAREPQYEVWLDGLVVARLDWAWPSIGEWIEVDGKAKYTKLLRPGKSRVTPSGRRRSVRTWSVA